MSSQTTKTPNGVKVKTFAKEDGWIIQRRTSSSVTFSHLHKAELYVACDDK